MVKKLEIFIQSIFYILKAEHFYDKSFKKKVQFHNCGYQPFPYPIIITQICCDSSNLYIQTIS